MEDNQVCIYTYQSHGGVLTSFHVVAPSVFYISLCMIPESDFCRPLYQVDSNKHSQLGLERKCSLIKCKFNAHNMTDHLIYGEICFAPVMGRREGMLTCLSCVSIRFTSAVKQSLTWQKIFFFFQDSLCITWFISPQVADMILKHDLAYLNRSEIKMFIFNSWLCAVMAL